MNPVLRQLCDICAASLRKSRYDEPLLDEKELLVLAKGNGLTGLIYPLIKDKITADGLAEKVERDYFAYVAADVKQKAVAEMIATALNECGIDHIFLKGYCLKPLYPESYMRAMGDIDLLVREDAREQVKEAFLAKQIIPTGKAEHHDNYQYGSDVLIEVHHTLLPERAKYLDDDPWELAHPIMEHRYEVEKEYEFVYLLTHLAKHFLSSGAGLRSILDIGLYLFHYQECLEHDKLEAYLAKTGLTRFFTNIVYLNNMLFGLDLPEVLYLTEPLLPEEYEELAGYIAAAGIHGYGPDFNSYSVEKATHRRKHKKGFAFYLGKVFPPYKTMKNIFPVLEKHKILLPFTWIARWFRLLGKRDTYRKLRKLFVKEKDVEANLSFYKKIGL